MIRGRYEAGGLHPVQHLVAPRLGRRFVVNRVVVARRLDQPRKRRALREGQLGSADTEVTMRSGLDAVGTFTEVDDVEVALEDLRLGELVLQGDGVTGLADLARERVRGRVLVAGRDEHVLHVLLRESAATLGGLAL